MLSLAPQRQHQATSHMNTSYDTNLLSLSNGFDIGLRRICKAVELDEGKIGFSAWMINYVFYQLNMNGHNAAFNVPMKSQSS